MCAEILLKSGERRVKAETTTTNARRRRRRLKVWV